MHLRVWTTVFWQPCKNWRLHSQRFLCPHLLGIELEISHMTNARSNQSATEAPQTLQKFQSRIAILPDSVIHELTPTFYHFYNKPILTCSLSTLYIFSKSFFQVLHNSPSPTSSFPFPSFILLQLSTFPPFTLSIFLPKQLNISTHILIHRSCKLLIHLFFSPFLFSSL